MLLPLLLLRLLTLAAPIKAYTKGNSHRNYFTVKRIRAYGSAELITVGCRLHEKIVKYFTRDVRFAYGSTYTRGPGIYQM